MSSRPKPIFSQRLPETACSFGMQSLPNESGFLFISKHVVAFSRKPWRRVFGQARGQMSGKDHPEQEGHGPVAR